MIDPPSPKKAGPAAGSHETGLELLERLQAAIGSPLGQALLAEGFDQTALEVIASILHLSTLRRAPRPVTSVSRLKHDCEMSWPTACGYVSEASMARAAVALGLTVRDGYVAVKQPVRPRGKGAR